MNFVKFFYKRGAYFTNLYHMSSFIIGKQSRRSFRNLSRFSLICTGETESVTWKGLSPISTVKRFKYNKSNKDNESNESDDELSDEDENYEDARISKLVVGYVRSLRTDGVLKAGLGMARNKIDTLFYESKIRVNGKKILKKSKEVRIGDEIDVIKERNHMNESLLTVSRIVLLSAKPNEEGDRLKIKMRRYKSLTIENYAEPWEKKED